MSTEIRHALRRGEPYLQSPIDDLESFYHVFVWAILHNKHWQRLNDIEKDCKDNLSGNVFARDGVQMELRKQNDTTLLKSDLRKLLDAWYSTQSDLRRKFMETEKILQYLRANNFFTTFGVTEQEFWKWSWHLIAFEGVRRILSDICKAMVQMIKHSGPF